MRKHTYFAFKCSLQPHLRSDLAGFGNILVIVSRSQYAHTLRLDAAHGQKQIIQRAQTIEQVRGLIRPGETMPGTILRAQAGHIPIEQNDSARAWLEFARHQVEQCRFASTIGTQNYPALAVRDVKPDIAYGLNTSKAAGNALQAQCGYDGL